MSITQRTLEYDHDGILCRGYFACDTALGPRRPAVMIAPTWAGCDAFARQKADALAELGYAAFALDMYGNGQVGEGAEECSRLMGALMDDRVLLQHRINAALSVLKAQPEVDPARVSAMGFCFGGLCVLDLARSGADLRAVVSFHGLFIPPPGGVAPLTPIKAKVLVLYGFDDPMASPEQSISLGRELTERGADWQLHLYGNTVHAFTNPRANDPGFGTVYNPIADRRSWGSLLDFLNEVLE